MKFSRKLQDLRTCNYLKQGIQFWQSQNLSLKAPHFILFTPYTKIVGASCLNQWNLLYLTDYPVLWKVSSVYLLYYIYEVMNIWISDQFTIGFWETAHLPLP